MTLEGLLVASMWVPHATLRRPPVGGSRRAASSKEHSEHVSPVLNHAPGSQTSPQSPKLTEPCKVSVCAG